MSKRRNRSLSLLISAGIVLIAECSTSRPVACPALDFDSVVASWSDLRPSNVTKLARPGFRVITEGHTNLSGAKFINVQFGSPGLPACRCCDTLSFEELSGTSRLVAVVSLRRASTLAEASDVASSFWMLISGDATAPPLTDVSISSPYTIRRAFGSEGSIGELSVSRDSESPEFIVRMYVGR